MRILFATSHKHLPELRGGMEVNTHELAIALQELGMDVGVLCGLAGRGWVGLKARLQIKLLGNACPKDTVMGYPTWRSWNSVGSLDQVVAAFKPNIIVIQGGADFDALLAACLRHDLPVFCYMHTQDELPIEPALLAHPKLHFLANSRFTSSLHEDKVIREIIRPLIRPNAYVTPTDRSAVVFVNPAPHKGLDIVLQLARARPDIPFIFVVNHHVALNALKQQLLAEGHRNIDVVGPIADMRLAYQRARLVIAPSQCFETWGRIATEAHFSGIPVLASDRGGLPEAVGPGGVCVPADASQEVWAKELSRIWDDPHVYAELSDAAMTYSRRAEIRADQVVDSFVNSLADSLQ